MNRPEPELVYVANAKIPGPRAHSVQIVRSCAAFDRAGALEQLLVPRRYGDGRDDPSAESLSRYYGVECRFACHRLSSLDLIDRLPRHWQLPAFLLQSWTFARSAHGVLSRLRPRRIYLRDPYSLYLLGPRLAPLGHRVYFEAHDLPQNRATRTRLQRALACASRVVAVNSHLAEAYRELGVDPDRLRIVPAAAVSGPATAAERRATHAELDLAPTSRVIGYAGSLSASKGVDTLIAAAARLDGVVLLLVGGDRQQVDWARDRLEAGQDARLLGRRPPADIPRHLAACDVLVAPNSGRDLHASTWTSPMKLFEYYDAARPIVATDTAALRAAVDELPEASRITWATPDDVDSLAGALRRALDTGIESPVPLAPRDGWLERAHRILDALDEP